MDLNGNKCEDRDEDRDEDNDFDDSNIPNVRSLKNFFQNQKQPIIGFKPLSDNRLELSSNDSINRSDNIGVNRSNRLIPRPPKAIQSCDIKVSPFLRSLVSNQCDRSVVQSMPSLPPVPKPRKSLQKKSSEYCDQKCDFEAKANIRPMNDLKSISGPEIRSNSLIESLNKEFKELNASDRNHRTASLQVLPNKDQTLCSNSFDSSGVTFSQTTDQMSVPFSEPIVEKNVISGKQNSNKSKKSFKSLRLKLLSIRRNTSQNNEKQRLKKSQTLDLNANSNQMRPKKPTRRPPEPPKLIFRPPAPLPPPEPNEDYYEDTLSMNREIANGLTNGFELYSDSVESEQIYCSLDNEDDDTNHSDIYEGIDDYDDGSTGRSEQTYICDNYYEDNTIDDFSDCERIYEVLPFETDSDSNVSNNSTISLDDNYSEIDTEVNAKEVVKLEPIFNSFDRKRNLKAIKLKKKFNLNGNEVPVNAGTVKEDFKGNRYDLFVRKGETVLILRMEGNPPGKWLAKNERSKVGFVDLDNISFDAESVKCIIKTLASHESGH